MIFRITKFFIILGDIIKQSLLDILESFEIKKLNCSFVLYPLYTKKNFIKDISLLELHNFFFFIFLIYKISNS